MLSDQEPQQFVDDQKNRCEKTENSALFDYGFHVRRYRVKSIELHNVSDHTSS